MRLLKIEESFSRLSRFSGDWSTNCSYPSTELRNCFRFADVSGKVWCV